MVDTLTLVAAFLFPTIGGLAWLFRLEGKVNTHEKVIEDVKDDVKYIRGRIDRALDGN